MIASWPGLRRPRVAPTDVEHILRFQYSYSRGGWLRVKEIPYPDSRVWAVTFPKQTIDADAVVRGTELVGLGSVETGGPLRTRPKRGMRVSCGLGGEDDTSPPELACAARMDTIIFGKVLEAGGAIKAFDKCSWDGCVSQANDRAPNLLVLDLERVLLTS